MNKDDKVIVVGAGVFGLSIALHLAREGFSDVTIFDSKPYDRSLYEQERGCDAASADVNKILRASYGEKAEYQRLAYSAREEWKQWNAGKHLELAATPPSQRPAGLGSTDEFYTECGLMRLPGSTDDPLSTDELAGLANLEKQFPEHRLKNYIIDDPTERLRAIADGWQETLDSVDWKGTGVLDATAGFVRADKSCIWLAHLSRKAGVHFIQGEISGKVVQFLEEKEANAEEHHVRGVKTADGATHAAQLVIVACGGWTPSLVPDTRNLLETTAGSIVSLNLPPRGERPDLWERFSGARWPVISRSTNKEARTREIYSLPHINGVIKIGYRATKESSGLNLCFSHLIFLQFTNYVDLPDGSRISVPVTAYTTPSQTNVPLIALQAAKDYIRYHFPQLVPFGISFTRLCWYTDSIDNDFLIDYVPGYGKSLFVASGGSGHGFKFAPILGAHVLDALYGRETDLTKLWQWRPVPQGKRNGLEEGEQGPRVLSKQKMATRDDWKFN
ncbi:FAD dependent oxidoreductase [Gautieria morchelliformis]|nr:FAD dependent oxidoreductase [Gautieria morchelliformis]